MKNYLISKSGDVKDLGDAKRRPKVMSAEGVTPVVHGPYEFVPPVQPNAGTGIVVQLAAAPTTEQIATAVRKLSVPKSLPSWRVEAVLKIAGKFDAAMAFIEALPEPQRTVTKCAWDRNELVERHGALLTTALPTIGVTDDEADEMFLQGAALVPN